MRIQEQVFFWGAVIAGVTASAMLVQGSDSTTNASFVEMARELSIQVGDDGQCLENRQSLTPLEAELRSPEVADKLAPQWGCVMLAQNLDRERGVSGHVFPSKVFELAKAKISQNQGALKVTGGVKYMGLKSEPFRYDVELDSKAPQAGSVNSVNSLSSATLGTQRLLISVRINFAGIHADQKIEMQTKLDQASKYWSDNSPNHSLRFSFKAVEPNEDAHFYVGFGLGEKRTQYYKMWWSDWHWSLMAHEIGHMLGLDDEYNQMRVTFRSRNANPVYSHQCQFSSIMCTYAWNAKPQKYHYYLILNRVINPMANADGDDET